MLQEYPDHWRSSFQIGGPEFLPTDHIAQPGMQAQCTPRGLGLEAGRRTDSDSSERPACPVFGGVSPAAESARARARLGWQRACVLARLLAFFLRAAARVASYLREQAHVNMEPARRESSVRPTHKDPIMIQL